jgi:hypothetical protein
MVITPFTWKKGIRGINEPTLFGNTIQLSSEVKYCRLTLDMGLSGRSSWIR